MEHELVEVRPIKINPKVEKILRQVATQLGDQAEQTVERIFSLARERDILPDWLYSWEHSAKYSEADIKGIDFTFMTDVGPVFIQIKSSSAAAKIFLERRGKLSIYVVIIDFRDSDKRNLEKLLREISKGRRNILAQ